MTIATIRAALMAELDLQAAQFGEDVNLSSTNNTIVTDKVAEIAGTLNPNSTYPPKAK